VITSAATGELERALPLAVPSRGGQARNHVRGISSGKSLHCVRSIRSEKKKRKAMSVRRSTVPASKRHVQNHQSKVSNILHFLAMHDPHDWV